jgi:hypothetical protein
MVSHAAALAVGYLDSDANLDVAVAGDTSTFVFLGRGNATFGQVLSVPVGISPVALAAGDFDQDGHVDVASAVKGSTSNIVDVYLGPGFTNALPSVHVNPPLAMAAAPLHGSSFPDLVVISQAPPGYQVISGSSTALTVTSPVSINAPFALALADLDGDGKVDLVTASTNGFSVYTGDGAGGFSAPTDFAISGTYPLAIAAADFDGDQKIDLALGAADTKVYLYRNTRP